MKKPKSVLLDYNLYVYACRHSELDDLQFNQLYGGVRKKLEAMTHHNLYSLYKSDADEEVQAIARREYLDAIGLSDSFR